MIDHFAFVAAVYDRLIGSPDISRMKRLLKLPAAGWLLDAGGGTGRVSAAVDGLVDHTVIGDLSAAMLKRSKGRDGLYPVRLRAEQLPFPDGTFSRVLIVDALHHFRDQQGAVGELLRILKPGGRLLIEEPDIDLWAVKGVALVEKMILMTSHIQPSGEIIRMIEHHGVSGRVSERDHFRVWICADK
ncbi:MAG: class I SAM-dependent methyltransferase [Deltaproteobacteria bacterium]|nr:class I SAM-dependent methyltransferase [Deltaproteobacteria bacterium]